MSELTHNVMSRVYTVYTIHKVKFLTFKAIFAVGALALVSSFVSFANVVENFKNTDNAFGFVTTAFTATELLVQALFVGLLVFAYFSVKDLVGIIRARRGLK